MARLLCCRLCRDPQILLIAVKNARGLARCRRADSNATALAPTANTMSPVPPATSPLPPATPTTVTAAHVAMRTDLHRLSSPRYSRHDAPADRREISDSNEESRQDTCQDAAATHCGLHLRVTSPNHRARPVTGFADGRTVGGMPCGPYCAVALFFAELLAARRRLTALFAEG